VKSSYIPRGRESLFTESQGKDTSLAWCRKFIGCGNKRTNKVLP
jgi:hypothetical protein